ncbi:MAG: hypothetical protein HQK75_05915 [Candidatus Magnetomorum sp.]|nr:hypothetical protein [Candidatus Magnetomorum sp.]
MKLIEWIDDINTQVKQIEIPEKIKSLVSAEGIPMNEGVSLVIRIEKLQTGEAITTQFQITENSQLLIPNHLLTFFEKSGEVRFTVLGSRGV